MYGSRTSWSSSGLTVQAIQELNLNLATIASTSASTTPQSEAFTGSFFDGVFSRLTVWLADAGVGIHSRPRT